MASDGVTAPASHSADAHPPQVGSRDLDSSPINYPGTSPLPSFDDLLGNTLPTAASEAAASGKSKVKFTNSYGEDAEEEVDLSDLSPLVSAKHRLAAMEEEMKALRDEVDSKKAQSQKEMDKARKYLELESRGRDALLEEALKEDGGLEGFRNKIIEDYEQFSRLTDSEKEAFNSKREKAESARRMVELEKKYSDALAKLGQKEQKLQEDSKIATLRNVYNVHKLPNASKDEAIDAINETIFRKAQSEIKRLESEKVVITESILNREFKKAAATFRGKIVTEKTDPNKAAREKLDEDTSKAQKVISAQSAQGQPPTELDVLKRWAGLAREGKLKQVTQEALSDPRYAGAYEKFFQMLQNDPKTFQRKR
jgi:hypothetical protein